MRAIIASFGTTGDVIPLCALASELERHGHQVTLAFPPHFMPLVRRFGLTFRSYGPDLEDVHRELLRLQLGGISRGPRFEYLFKSLFQTMPRVFSDLAVLCRGADVLLCTNDPPIGLMIHETTGIPFATIRLDYPGDDRWDHPEKEAAVNGVRKLLGLQPVQVSGSYDPAVMSPQLVLFAVSRHIFPSRQQLLSHHYVTGFFYQEEEAWTPDSALARFLEDGPPPILISFGSMVHEDAGSLTDLLVQAVEQVGSRAIIQAGWSGLSEGREMPAFIHPLGFAPHSWLFPRMACVVMHCGAGTSAAVFRAGVPGVFVPQLFDQFDLADGVHALGYAGPPIRFSELTADRLSAGISDALTTERRSAATALQKRIQEENGVQTARRLVEQLVESKSAGPLVQARTARA